MWALDDLHTEDQVAYFLGFFVDDLNIPIEHAWLSLNGKLIDPTFNIWGAFQEDQFAYLGVSLSVKDYAGLMLEANNLPGLLDTNIWRLLATRQFEMPTNTPEGNKL